MVDAFILYKFEQSPNEACKMDVIAPLTLSDRLPEIVRCGLCPEAQRLDPWLYPEILPDGSVHLDFCCLDREAILRAGAMSHFNHIDAIVVCGNYD